MEETPATAEYEPQSQSGSYRDENNLLYLQGN
jgi:hypothetical protein